MVEFRLHAAAILRRIQRGERLVLTHRGKAVARLEPVRSTGDEADDAFLRLEGIAKGKAGENLTNRQIDALLYHG